MNWGGLSWFTWLLRWICWCIIVVRRGQHNKFVCLRSYKTFYPSLGFFWWWPYDGFQTKPRSTPCGAVLLHSVIHSIYRLAELPTEFAARHHATVPILSSSTQRIALETSKRFANRDDELPGRRVASPFGSCSGQDERTVQSSIIVPALWFEKCTLPSWRRYRDLGCLITREIRNAREIKHWIDDGDVGMWLAERMGLPRAVMGGHTAHIKWAHET